MNRTAVAIALVLCFPLAAYADDASRRAKAEELLALLHMERVSTQVMDNILHQTTAITAQRSGGTMTPATQAALADFQKRVVAVLEPQVGWKAIGPDYIRLCADAFTDEQLDAILAFYKSPGGAALLDKMPSINQQINQLIQPRIAALQPQMNQMLNDFEKGVVKPAPALTPLVNPSAPPALAPAPALPPAPGKGPVQ